MTPWVLFLIVANAAILLVTRSMPGLLEAFGLVPALIIQRPWTLITYMFLHAGFQHLFWNMLALWFFGPRVEARQGPRRVKGQ